MARAAMTADQQRQATQQLCVTDFGARIADLEQAGYPYEYKWGGVAPATAATAAYRAAVTLLTTAQTGLVPTAQPDVARNFTVTSVLAGADLDAGSNVTVRGTDINGNALTETLDVAGAAGTYQSLKAFKTITSYDLPVRKTAADTLALGSGAKLGLPKLMFSDSILLFNTSGVKDTYTLVQSTAEVAKNLLTPNLAPNAVRTYRITFIDQRS